MADAKKCDRCGGFYIPSSRRTCGVATLLSFKVNCIDKTFDLCDECLDEFDRWMLKFQPGNSQ